MRPLRRRRPLQRTEERRRCPRSRTSRDDVRRQTEDARIVYWKVGLNSPPVQRHPGLPVPVLDYPTHAAIAEPGATLRLRRDARHLVEAAVFA